MIQRLENMQRRILALIWEIKRSQNSFAQASFHISISLFWNLYPSMSKLFMLYAEEGNNGEGSEKDKTGSFSLGEALEKWFTDPVTDIPAFEAYVFDESDFKPSESVGEWMGNDEMPLSPQESSNRDFGDEDGIKLSDLDSDLDGEGHGSTSDL
ncbi:unnamed protein product [Cochlearia groenlandica]